MFSTLKTANLKISESKCPGATFPKGGVGGRAYQDIGYGGTSESVGSKAHVLSFFKWYTSANLYKKNYNGKNGRLPGLREKYIVTAQISIRSFNVKASTHPN